MYSFSLSRKYPWLTTKLFENICLTYLTAAAAAANAAAATAAAAAATAAAAAAAHKAAISHRFLARLEKCSNELQVAKIDASIQLLSGKVDISRGMHPSHAYIFQVSPPKSHLTLTLTARLRRCYLTVLCKAIKINLKLTGTDFTSWMIFARWPAISAAPLLS